MEMAASRLVQIHHHHHHHHHHHQHRSVGPWSLWIRNGCEIGGLRRPQFLPSYSSSLPSNPPLQLQISHGFCVLASLPPSSSPKTTSHSSTKLYVSVNLVMDRIAKRPRGFAFLRYATEEESTKAIEGMHGKFLDGRVIFVEVAKPRSELRQDVQQKRIQY
ncbi:hypothetical protein ACSBR1_014321 [Camellia fascicularis]